MNEIICECGIRNIDTVKRCRLCGYNFILKQVKVKTLDKQIFSDEATCEIRKLKRENAKLYLEIKEIQSLKAQLKREMECVDFYADKNKWEVGSEINKDNQIINDTDHYPSFYQVKGGRLARETVRARGL